MNGGCQGYRHLGWRKRLPCYPIHLRPRLVSSPRQPRHSANVLSVRNKVAEALILPCALFLPFDLHRLKTSDTHEDRKNLADLQLNLSPGHDWLQ